ncbi:MAG TPA: hypothetical protein VLF89_03550 [Candidatus Saccharimonadales bacterium]|nr:hypothetical protein [Candidatus Saccharimonadales bacterium]
MMLHKKNQINKWKLITNINLHAEKGFSVLEIILAAALFMIFSIGMVSVVLQGFDANRLGSEETIANQYASEGIEAVRSIKNQGFSNIVNSAGTGVVRSGSSVWAFSGTNNTFGKYTRVITVTDTQRDSSGNIVASGGTVDPNTKTVTATVSWNVSPTRNNSVVLTSYMTAWKTQRGGMVVFSDGSTTPDTISYRTLDQDTQTWSGSTGTGTVTLDTANMSNVLVTTTSATTASWNHTVGAQSNKLLMVQVSTNHDTTLVSSIKYAGVALTKLAAVNCTTSAASCRDEIWYLINPPQGTAAVFVTQSAAGLVAGTAETFYNVNTASPFENSGVATTTNPVSTGTSLSISVPSAATDLVADWYTNRAGPCQASFTLSSGQTLEQNVCNSVAQGVGTSIKTGAVTSTTMSWSWTDAQQYAYVGIAIKPSSTATFGTVTDVDSGSINKVARALRLYSSATRNEKILISRHYNGTAQFIYATVWNGSSWGTPLQLSTWTAATFLDVQNFDGAYLNDGTFMVVYSDNTIIPKYRIWNGTSWAAQGSLTTLGTSQIPIYIVAKARPSTNEVMAAFFTQGGSTTTANTITEYWSGSAWSAIVTHSALSITNTKKYVDFQWSPNLTTTGALIYADSSTDTTLATKIFVANGAGSGTWGTAVQAAAQTNNLAALDLQPRPGANEFQACDKDAAATPTIVCRKITFSGTVPTLTTPTNPILVTGTDTGIQRSFDFGFESISGAPAIMVYSSNTAVPQFKKYTASSSTWDAAATAITTTGSPGVIKTVRIIPQEQGDDMIALVADANLDVYSIFWNGSGDAMYTTPASKAFTLHGTNGSAITDFWYDFAWDKF